MATEAEVPAGVLAHVAFFDGVSALIPASMRGDKAGPAQAPAQAPGKGKKGKGKGKGAAAAAAPAAQGKSASEGIEALRARLHERIASVAPKRKAVARSGERDRKKARREGPERQDRKGNLRKGDVAQKMKEAAEERKAAKAAQKKARAEARQAARAAGSDGSGAGDLLFGRIENKAEKKKPDYKDMVKKKVDKHKMLRKAEAFQRKVQALPEDEAKRVVHDKAVSSALLKAQGITVKDNVKILKKAIKRDDRSRAKSARQWANRKKTEEGTFKTAGEGAAPGAHVSHRQLKRDRKKAKAAVKAHKVASKGGPASDKKDKDN